MAGRTRRRGEMKTRLQAFTRTAFSAGVVIEWHLDKAQPECPCQQENAKSLRHDSAGGGPQRRCPGPAASPERLQGRVHRRYTGCTPEERLCIRCTSGVHPVCIRCTWRETLESRSRPRLVGTGGLPGNRGDPGQHQSLHAGRGSWAPTCPQRPRFSLHRFVLGPEARARRRLSGTPADLTKAAEPIVS
jgi:hypothetical protein